MLEVYCIWLEFYLKNAKKFFNSLLKSGGDGGTTLLPWLGVRRNSLED